MEAATQQAHSRNYRIFQPNFWIPLILFFPLRTCRLCEISMALWKFSKSWPLLIYKKRFVFNLWAFLQWNFIILHFHYLKIINLKKKSYHIRYKDKLFIDIRCISRRTTALKKTSGIIITESLRRQSRYFLEELSQCWPKMALGIFSNQSTSSLVWNSIWTP